MLPLGLLTAAQGQPMLVELKSGDSVQGHLLSCDTFMNVMLKEAIQTSADGQKFVGLRECYIRGSNIKYLRIPDQVVERVKEQQQSQQSARGGRGGQAGQRGGPGGRGDRGRGAGRGGRGRGRGRG